MTILLLAGCARWRGEEIISNDLPLSLKDIDEIRAGDEAHNRLFSERLYEKDYEKHYRLYTSPELNAYVALIGKRLARVSDRPNLPYRFFIVDTDEVSLFGLAGGRVYVSRGFLNFVESESELASGLAHEIGHIASHHYRPGKKTRWETVYDLMLKGADQAKGAAPPYTSATPYGVKAFGYGTKKIKKAFSGDQERQADARAIRYLVKAGYDPRAFAFFVERLSKIPAWEVGAFVDYLKGHPPVQKRREFLHDKTKKFDSEKLKVPEEPLASVIPAIEALLIESEVSGVPVSSQREALPAVEKAAFVSQT